MMYENRQILFKFPFLLTIRGSVPIAPVSCAGCSARRRAMSVEVKLTRTDRVYRQQASPRARTGDGTLAAVVNVEATFTRSYFSRRSLPSLTGSVHSGTFASPVRGA
eukprot:4945052-Pleurochrysis_carterae.AAC.6